MRAALPIERRGGVSMTMTTSKRQPPSHLGTTSHAAEAMCELPTFERLFAKTGEASRRLGSGRVRPA
jgi:hypothetical protein